MWFYFLLRLVRLCAFRQYLRVFDTYLQERLAFLHLLMLRLLHGRFNLLDIFFV